jgi:hypothetical protein
MSEEIRGFYKKKRRRRKKKDLEACYSIHIHTKKKKKKKEIEHSQTGRTNQRKLKPNKFSAHNLQETCSFKKGEREKGRVRESERWWGNVS